MCFQARHPTHVFHPEKHGGDKHQDQKVLIGFGVDRHLPWRFRHPEAFLQEPRPCPAGILTAYLHFAHKDEWVAS